jgi:hypothetical protein
MVKSSGKTFRLGIGCLAACFFSCSYGPPPPSKRKEIAVVLAGNSFNPSRNETLPIVVLLPPHDKAEVSLHEDHGLMVRSLFRGSSPQDSLALLWDGRDDSGEVLPDEAYYVKVTCIKGRDTVILDPPTFSGGEMFSIGQAAFDPERGTLQYTLPRDARIIIRAGELKGLLLKNIVHLAPRTKGEVLEYWNGKDSDNLLSVKQLTNWQAVIAGISLPNHTVVTYGNEKAGYEDYFSRRLSNREFRGPRTKFSGKFQTFLQKTGREVGNHFTLPLSQNHAPLVSARFPNAPDTLPEKVPLLRGTQRVEIDIDQSDKLFPREQQFEIMFYVDGKLVAEDEVGYIPYNWVWNSAEVSEGEHIISVNLASFKDQIGTKSLKVMVRHK